MTGTDTSLFYIHDPMCSWCWGFRPTWDALKRALPTSIHVINLTGGLAPDSDQVMPIAMQQTIEDYWHTIQQQLGTEFNFDFWRKNQPRRSTYIACRAAIAADNQGAQDTMIDAIQQAYYLRALNPSDRSVLLQLAAELELQTETFTRDLESPVTHAEFKRQRALAHSLPIQGFPSLVLKRGEQLAGITLNYLDVKPMLDAIAA
ncbi:DsbA family protein [Oceanicoccus sp. KOV_DT_Chl]|uniref:DsbA family protein n=1 Tax=Oceanicoccus sp. KOV_DT_Chl TaxID=1904639 RepID=UPI000C7B93CB|nr:DsbA family protein [Oceanicoccus sp. KOV_DT_Chl]